MKDNKHEFALFYSDLSLQNKSSIIAINDASLITRITSVLRLKQGDALTLFNATMHVQGVLESCSKKSFSFSVEAWHDNKKLKPHVTVLLPLLKRDSLESALYSCVALGASFVQLVSTEKTRKWQGAKELERLQRIAIAAAEQSKNFYIPSIKEPLNLEKALKNNKAEVCLFADPEGASYFSLVSEGALKKEIILFVGPEGDLTTSEKKLLKDRFSFVALTPTILKSEHALALLLGVVRMTT